MPVAIFETCITYRRWTLFLFLLRTIFTCSFERSPRHATPRHANVRETISGDGQASRATREAVPCDIVSGFLQEPASCVSGSMVSLLWGHVLFIYRDDLASAVACADGMGGILLALLVPSGCELVRKVAQGQHISPDWAKGGGRTVRRHRAAYPRGRAAGRHVFVGLDAGVGTARAKAGLLFSIPMGAALHSRGHGRRPFISNLQRVAASDRPYPSPSFGWGDSRLRELTAVCQCRWWERDGYSPM